MENQMVFILESPVTERYVKKGDMGKIDYSVIPNQIKVNGCWFGYDERWNVIELNNEICDFVIHVLTIAERNNVKFTITKDEHIKYPNSEMLCSGYFVDNGAPELGIAVGGKVEEWLEILVHEYSHMEQFLDNCEHWKNNFVGKYESIDLISNWIGGEEIENVEHLIDLSFNVETDCDTRAIENIKKHKLPIDIPDYYQKSNSYTLFYGAILEHKKWYDKDKKPYLIKEVWSAMPNDRIITDWKKEYPLYQSLYSKYCF